MKDWGEEGEGQRRKENRGEEEKGYKRGKENRGEEGKKKERQRGRSPK